MIDPENPVPTIKQYPLEKKKILKKFITLEIFPLLFFVIFFIIFLLINSLILLVSITFLLLLFSAFNWWYQVQYYNRYYYDIRKNFLVIKKGVFTPRETLLPFEKLQDVYLDQDLLDRVFTIWDLHVSTATAMSGQEAHIDGVNIQNCEAMREILLEKIKQNK